MKTDVKAFKVDVNNIGGKDGYAFVICVTYGLDTISKYYGGEFYELLSNYEKPKLNIPTPHTFTFREAFIVFGNTNAIAPDGRKDIEKWIETKMKEVYGDNCNVTIKDLVQ